MKLERLKGSTSRLLVVALIALASAPAMAEARTCPPPGVALDDGYATLDVYHAATCGFGNRAVRSFYRRTGTPRRMTILGTRLTLVESKDYEGLDGRYWFYNGRRHGRYVSLFISEFPFETPTTPEDPVPPANPADPSPTYPVPCADGTTSQSGGHQGACSHHGGLA